MYPPFRASWQTVIRPSTSFPLPPLKFRTAGFPQYRLQTRLTPRPPSPACPRRLIGRHCRYLRPRRLIRNRTCVQAAPRTSDHDRESSGPWLPSPVVLSGRLVAYYGHICASGGHPTAYGLFRQAAGPTRQPQRVPNLLCQSVHPMPSPVLRWSPRLLSTMPSSRVLPSPSLHGLGHHMPHDSESRGSA